MGVSVEEYRQRIGSFAGVATVLSSVKVRGYKRNTRPKQSKDFGTVIGVIIRRVDYAFHSLTKGLRLKL